MLQGNIALEACDVQALKNLGMVEGNCVNISFVSGISVSGRIISIIKNNQKVILISFEDCTVMLDGKELFKKEWGTYDMAVGSQIVSAYPGAADPASYFSATLQQAECMKEPPSSLTELEILYQKVATIREKNTFTNECIQVLCDIYHELNRSYPNDWLLRLELLELAAFKLELKQLELPIKEELNELSKVASFTNLIKNGFSIIYV